VHGVAATLTTFLALAPSAPRDLLVEYLLDQHAGGTTSVLAGTVPPALVGKITALTLNDIGLTSFDAGADPPFTGLGDFYSTGHETNDAGIHPGKYFQIGLTAEPGYAFVLSEVSYALYNRLTSNTPGPMTVHLLGLVDGEPGPGTYVTQHDMMQPYNTQKCFVMDDHLDVLGPGPFTEARFHIHPFNADSTVRQSGLSNTVNGLVLGQPVTGVGKNPEIHGTLVLLGALEDGQTTTLNPGGGSPVETAQVEITNLSGTNGAEIWAGTDADPLHPDAGGFGVLSTQLLVDTSLDDGEYFMTVVVPVDAASLGGANPLLVDLVYYDKSSGDWELATSSNTAASPGHAGPIGDRHVVLDSMTPVPPQASAELGDYGVFWNSGQAAGYVWANVDHTTFFAAGIEGVFPMGCGVNPSASLAPLAGGPTLGQTLTLGVDDPLGSSPPGSVAVLLASLQADPAFPCGTALPGYGMAGPTGELLVNVLPPDPIAVLGPAPWSGPGSPAAIAVPVPDDGGLLGLGLHFQGLVVGPSSVKVTDGLRVVIGS